MIFLEPPSLFAEGESSFRSSQKSSSSFLGEPLDPELSLLINVLSSLLVDAEPARFELSTDRDVGKSELDSCFPFPALLQLTSRSPSNSE